MGGIIKGVLLVSIGVAAGYAAAVLTRHRQPMMYVFDSLKNFTALPGYVYVSGTLTGDGIDHRYNTVQVTCYRDRKVCLTNGIDGISNDMCQMSRLDSPAELAVDRWDENEVEANGATGLCFKTTIVINFNTEVALWVEEPANKYDTNCPNAQTHRWTIEKADMFNPQPKGRLDD